MTPNSCVKWCDSRSVIGCLLCANPGFEILFSHPDYSGAGEAHVLFLHNM